MSNAVEPTVSQLTKDIAPAASPLGTDDEAGGTTPSADRVEMARKAEERIEASAKQKLDEHQAHEQRESSND